MDIATISVGGTGGLASPAASLPPPNPADVETFNGIYGAPPGEGAGSGDRSEGATGALGEGFQKRIEQFERTHDNQVHALQQALNALSGSELGPKDMLEVQRKLNELEIAETYALKVGEKSSEGIKSLFTNQ